MTSFLGRLNYDYENKYYFSASFRRDGSSRLSRESRWGDFWSVSGSWRITSESFMENIKEVITDAKLRASYGVNSHLIIMVIWVFSDLDTIIIKELVLQKIVSRILI